MREPEVLIAFIFATLAFVVLPMVWLMLAHQRRMAELIHGKAPTAIPPQVVDPQLANEMAMLRQTLAQQAIAIDSLAESQRLLAQSLAGEKDVRERLTH